MLKVVVLLEGTSVPKFLKHPKVVDRLVDTILSFGRYDSLTTEISRFYPNRLVILKIFFQEKLSLSLNFLNHILKFVFFWEKK